MTGFRSGRCARRSDMGRAPAPPGARRLPWGVVPSLLTALALAGCAGLPVAATVDEVDHPVVTPDQAQRIAAAADEVVTPFGLPGVTWDPDLAATRLTGPAAQWAEFSAPGGRTPPVGILAGAGGQGLVIAPRAADWPRAFAILDGTAGTAGTAGTGQVIRVFVSDSARLPYRLWAAMPVLESAMVPAFRATDADTGTEVPGGDAAGGERPLTAVLADLSTRYIDVLTHGDASAYAPEFESDGFAAALRARVEAERSRLAPEARTQVTHEMAQSADQPGVVLSVLAANGDALVIVAFATTLASTVEPGAPPIVVPEDLAGPAGATRVDGTLSTRSVAALAFVVPATTGNIRVLAAADSITDVSTSSD